jgi:hypothetical protein
MNPIIKVWLAIVITGLLIISATGILEDAMHSKPKQIGLMKQFPKTRQTNGGSDTLLFWGIGPFGKTFPLNANPMCKDQRNIYILTM